MSTRSDGFYEPYVGKFVRIVSTDGHVVEDIVEGYSNGYDEEDGEASVDLTHVSFSDNEIASIEIIRRR